MRNDDEKKTWWKKNPGMHKSASMCVCTVCTYDSHIMWAIRLVPLWEYYMPAGAEEGIVAWGGHKCDQAIIILLFYVYSSSKLSYPILKALVLCYKHGCMHMCKCRVTMQHVDNWISRPRVAAHTHTPKSCTYNTFMYILFGEIQKISSYFTGKVTGVRPTICWRNCLTNYGQILL